MYMSIHHTHTHAHTHTHTHTHTAIVNRRDHTHSLTQLDYGTENIDTASKPIETGGS